MSSNRITTVIALITILLSLLIIFLRRFIMKPSKEVYLVDFACYKPKETQKVTTKLFISRFRTYFPNIKEETLQIMEKMINKSGLGQSTYGSTGLLMKPPRFSLEESRKEAEDAVFEVVKRLLEKTGVKAEEVDILVVNCSLFNPVPSLCSMVVNRFKMRDDVKCYNLSGMGCSAGLISMQLANNLLQVHENSYVLVASTEILNQHLYLGNDRSKLPPNCAFRVGGTAILLSNRRANYNVAKYRLVTAIRTNTSKSDNSYTCVFQEEDSQGIRGISTTKDLIPEAQAAIRANLVALGPTILPVTEQIRYVVDFLARKLKVAREGNPYVPKFGQTVDHFITHVGGKPVIDAVERFLGFRACDMEASRMTLYRFGNTSSSSVWYGLAYQEAKSRVKKGDRVWQIGFGAGFECTSVVWRALRNVQGCEKVNPWMDEIHKFPLDLNKVELGSSSSSGPSFFELSTE